VSRDQPQHVEPAALSAARDRFNDLAQQFANSRSPLSSRRASIISGAGQFGAEVDDGATAFMLSWQTVFDVASDDAGLIAANVGRYQVDLETVDKDLTVKIEL
jgi:hypothetical protein